MNILMFLPFLSVVGFSTFLANYARIRFVFTVPAVLSTILLVIYVADVLGILYYTTPSIIIMGLLCLVWSFVKYPELPAKIGDFKYEIILVMLMLLFAFWIYKEALLDIWDDLAFWAVFSKEMFVNNATFINEGTSAVLSSHYHYPRGPSYFHYFSLYFSGISDSGLLTSHFMMHLLLAMPFFAGRHFFQGVIFLMLFYRIPWRESFALISVYNDSTIGFVATSCIGTWFLCENKKKAIFLLLPTFFMFSVYREIGLWIGIFTGVIISVAMFLYEKKIAAKQKIVISCILIALPVLSNYLWFTYVDMFGALGRDPHKLSTIIGIMQDIIGGHEAHISVIKIFLSKLLGSLNSQTFLFLYVTIIFTTSMIFVFQKQYLRSYLLLIVVATVCFMFFLMFRLYIYLLMKDTVYGTLDNSIINIGCLIRYSASYLIIYVAISAVYLSKIINEININKYILSISIIVVVAIFINLFSKKYQKLAKIDQHNSSFFTHIDLVNTLSSLKHNITYDYTSGDLEKANTVRKCYVLSYYLYPNYSNQDRIECLNYTDNLGKAATISQNQIVSNVDVNEILKDDATYNCNIHFNVHHNNLDIVCSKKSKL